MEESDVKNACDGIRLEDQTSWKKFDSKSDVVKLLKFKYHTL